MRAHGVKTHSRRWRNDFFNFLPAKRSQRNGAGVKKTGVSAKGAAAQGLFVRYPLATWK
jgi:hypothetical protein